MGSQKGAYANEPKIIAGPMLTMVSPDELVVWFQADRLATFGVYVIGTHGDCVHPRKYVKAELVSEKQRIFLLRRKIKLPSYWQVFIAWSDQEEVTDHWDWKTLLEMNFRPSGLPPPLGKPGKYVFAFGSCSHQEKFCEAQPVWTAVAAEKPDCFLFIGDNMYLPSDPADYPKTREAVRDLFCDAYDRERCVAEKQALLRSTLSFAIWDDHDYGPNNADRRWKWKDVALEALELYYPNNYGLPDARGCFPTAISTYSCWMTARFAIRTRIRRERRCSATGNWHG
ncbi:MAG TPA: hypothetical protein VNT79_16490 [Phycisphaerae bacterium]|nr:hypothetical protein [Phycisphaerae bacterium]